MQRGVTDEAKKWEGWGTSLKPSHQLIAVMRKPFKGTLAENLVKHGVGAMNIDGCRVDGKLPPNIVMMDEVQDIPKFYYTFKPYAEFRFAYCKKCDKVIRYEEIEGHKHGSKKYEHIVFHHTQKPEKLVEWLVKLVTPKGGIVLDPFAGTCVTGYVAKKLGMNYVCIEIEEVYCRIGKRRIGLMS